MRLNLGSRNLPNALLPKLQTVFGVEKAEDVEAAVQEFVWWNLLQHFLQQRQVLLEPTLRARRDEQQTADRLDFLEIP